MNIPNELFPVIYSKPKRNPWGKKQYILVSVCLYARLSIRRCQTQTSMPVEIPLSFIHCVTENS